MRHMLAIAHVDGYTDEEPATSIVAEADIICYIVTHARTQESAFSLLKSL